MSNDDLVCFCLGTSCETDHASHTTTSGESMQIQDQCVVYVYSVKISIHPYNIVISYLAVHFHITIELG